MVPAEAASRDVWSFLALVLLPDVAFWRYPRPPGDRVLGTDLTRHVFGRLWWRAQLVRSPDEAEPYGALHILGEAAFDQIYARREALGGSPHLVRSILRVWNDLDRRGLNERDTLRDFLKRLLRLAPFVLFDGIEEASLDAELRYVAQESVDAQRPRTVPATPAVSASPASPAEVVREAGTGASPASSGDEGERAKRRLTSVEICAGSGAQALGLERAGFDPVLLIDAKADACFTIARNRPHWEVVCMDLLEFHTEMRPEVKGVDLLSGGLPRVKSTAGISTSQDADERRVLRASVALACSMRPRAVLLENLPGLVQSPDFAADRAWIQHSLEEAGYRTDWRVLNAADFGVPQNRSSGFLVALQEPLFSRFSWPEPSGSRPPTVGQALGDSMASGGWTGAAAWARAANSIAPALVGGSENRGGADLGPTGSKKAWAALGVNGDSLGDAPPGPDFPEDATPKLTVCQAAMIQSIPEGWAFHGRKTSTYRQIGHAMPPPLAEAVGRALAQALRT
ncbi:DNA cytosine methyltransferase [Streptomyces zhihengii]|uniref:DNA (cytosine-5-)-methyltransferase n=2 Tax=Streptomyces zhihengii TaxID=1818004 RepID=A0ABS2UVB2_9ACTN|nr:DNA cytosine methyltransferase [Streptomyces zhihengii]